MMTPAHEPWFMLTPAGVLHAYAARVPGGHASGADASWVGAQVR
ncbi:MAG: hypothetical protein ACK5NW_02340 [Ottowia sp.]